jgi:ligand-binding sensor domain-containing protein/serine phosphatase RsbU (regulator of sigma subunit)
MNNAKCSMLNEQVLENDQRKSRKNHPAQKDPSIASQQSNIPTSHQLFSPPTTNLFTTNHQPFPPPTFFLTLAPLMHSNPAVRFRLFFLLLFAAFSAHAQDYKFNRLGVEDGLSQSVINCILEDNKGFMWFGTQEGLNRYDGYSFDVFKRDPEDSNSLSNNFIYSLLQDHNGVLWIGTNGGGLNSFNPVTGQFKNYLHDPNVRTSISNDVVRAIYEDKNGKLWIGTDGGLNVFDAATEKFISFENNPNDQYSISSNNIYDIIEDANGNIWIGTYGKGLSMYDQGKRRFYNYELSNDDLNRLYPNLVTSDLKRRSQCSQVRDLLLYDATHIWVGTDGGGIELFNITTHAFESVMYPNERSTSIASSAVLSMNDDQRGNIWIAMFGGGVDIFNKATKSIQHYTSNENDEYALSSSGIRCIYPDRNGNIWVGTNGEGLNVYFISTSTIGHIRRSERPGVGENTLMSSKILSVMEDKNGLLWIGTSEGGLSSLDRTKGIYTHHPELSTSTNNSVLCLLQSSDGSIWAGTWGEGLNRKDPEGKVTSYTPDNQLKNGAILCITEEPSTGAIWFGTFGAGLYRLDPKTDSLHQFTVESDNLSSNYIYSVYFDRSGALWVGTRAGGVMRYNASTQQFVSYKHDDKNKKSLSNNIVYCVTEDLQGNIWMSTASGLDRFDPKTGSFDIWYEHDGLPSDNIYAILIDVKGNLWLSHNKGLTRFNPTVVKGDLFKNYGKAAGVQPSEFNQGAFFKNKKGELFFGGQAGLNIIDPQKIEMKFPAPNVYITSYRRFGKEIHLDTSIVNLKVLNVSWRDNNFMFQLAALNFVDPQKNLYQYKLDGIDDEWSEITSNRYVSYTNLPGGNYTLHVRAADSNGNWSEDKELLRIHVEPPFWKTNWFYSLCVVVLVAGIFTFIRMRTAAIKKENRILEAKVAERTQELAQKNADITSSIQYAKRIQSATLPELDVIYEHFPQSFVLYKPKDIVSGDFYWFEEKNGKYILGVGDCTGHGVPGALMSMIGHNILNQVVLEKGITEPDQILNSLNDGVRSALKQDQHEQDTTDGMDIGIISYDKVKKEILFAGALRPLIVVKKGILSKVDSDRFPIGGSQDTRDMKFSMHRFFVEPGDTLYMFSDGYADQFGGIKGKKFMIKNLIGKLQSIQELPMHEQAFALEQTFEDWKAGFQQVDDVLVVGVRIT